MMVIARLLAVVLLALAGACGGKSCPPAGPAPIAEAPGSSEPWDLGDPRASAGGGEDEEEDEDEGDDDDGDDEGEDEGKDEGEDEDGGEDEDEDEGDDEGEDEGDDDDDGGDDDDGSGWEEETAAEPG